MQEAPMSIIAPGLIEQTWNEAEVLGSVAWLWMHSASHCNLPLHTLPTLLLPAIKNRQFVLVSQSGRAIFYLSWANLSLDAESRYVSNSALLMPQEDWNSGSRMWVLDWVAPFGHTQAMTKLVRKQLLANRWWRALYHRGNERGLQIRTFRGLAVLPEEAQEWFNTHPVGDTTRKTQSFFSDLSQSVSFLTEE